MKAKLFFLALVLALSVILQPSPSAAVTSCQAFCARVRCLGEYICGPFVNSSGQTVCGCHPRDF